MIGTRSGSGGTAMLNHPTIAKLHELRLFGMANAFELPNDSSNMLVVSAREVFSTAVAHDRNGFACTAVEIKAGLTSET